MYQITKKFLKENQFGITSQGLIKYTQTHFFRVFSHIPYTKYLIPITLSLILYTFPSIPYAHASILTKPPNNLGLVGYWNFNEGTSTYAGDYSVNNNTGTLTSGPTWVDGKLGKAINFDGTNDYVNGGSGGSLDPLGSNWTVSAWIRTTDTSGAIVCKEGMGSSSGCDGDYYILEVVDGEAQFQFSAGSGSTATANGNSAVNNNQWHHIVGVRSGSKTADLYVDGILQATNTHVGSWTGIDSTSSLFIATEAQLTNFLSGSIDDLRIYNRSLIASEVASLYKSGGARFNTSSVGLTQGTTLANGLVGHWTFDGKDTTNTTATDLSGQGNTGTFTGFTRATNAKAGKLGQGLSFDGVNDYVNVPSVSGFNSITTKITFSAWVKSPTPTAERMDIIQRSGGGDNWWFNLQSGKVSFYADNITGGVYKQSTTAITSTDWTYISATYDGSNIRFYINGVLDNTIVATGSFNTNGTIINIARNYFGSGSTYFNGPIDDVRIYNRALSASEVKQLYNLGSAKAQASSVTLGQGTTLANGIVGHWTFDGKDTTNTTATDLSGQGNTGTFTGFTRATNAKAGKLGQGMSFDGVDDYVLKTVSNYQSGDSAGTISVWFKTNSTASVLGLIGSSDTATTNSYLFFGMNISGATGSVYIQNNTGITNQVRTNATTFNDGLWHHAVLVSNGTAWSIYIDGVNQSLTVVGGSNTGDWFADSVGRDNLTIGNLVRTSAIAHFPGSLDDVRVYNRTLSANEVKQLYLIGK